MVRALACCLGLVTAALLGCDKPPEPGGSSGDGPARTSATPTTTAQAPPSAVEPASDLPAEWRLPLGWRWLTATKLGFTVAFPGLPTLDPQPPGGQRLVARSDRVECAVGVAPERDEVPRYRREIARQGWTILADRAVAGGTEAIDATNGRLTTHTRLVPAGARTFVVTFTTAQGDDADASTFLDSFRPSAVLESRTLRFGPGGFTVAAPARMSEWQERSADPPLRGLAGLVDGAQLSAAFADVGTAAAGAAREFLEHGLAASLGELGGATVARDAAPFRGHPSIRIEHRGANGVYITRRVLLAGERFYDVAVYAPNGTKPPWADAFVDSLVVGR